MAKLSPEEFHRLSRPVFGCANPERIDNPLWLSILESPKVRRWSGWHLRRHFRDTRERTSSGDQTWRSRESEVPPPWCWERMGQTRTELPDGRVIYVGGEHEDWYDDDFCIFSDVVVESAGGVFEIYAYPVEVFPPTDFHSATLVGDALILTGNLGYADTRRDDETQVLRLDLRSFAIEPVMLRGEGPGWVSGHEAILEADDRIRVSGGKVIRLKPGCSDGQKESVDLDGDYWLTPDPNVAGGYVWERSAPG